VLRFEPQIKMVPQKQYTLADFLRFAHGTLPSHLADVNLYKFAKRIVVDKKERTRGATLLFLGQYWFKEGDLQSWAHATSSGISYYTGKSGRVCKPIPRKHQAKIYHEHPFDQLFEIEGRNCYHRNDRYEPTLNVKDSVIETAIVFAFLYTGQLHHIENFGGVDMLNNFKLACANFHDSTMKVKAESPVRELSRSVEAPDVEEVPLPSKQGTRKKRRRIDIDLGLSPTPLIRPPRTGRNVNASESSPQRT
jgi:hypothetical protein